MTNRRKFLQTSLLGAGAFAFNPVLNNLMAGQSQNISGHPKRFIFIRKGSGLRPSELALPTFSEQQKRLDNDKMQMEADLDKHDLPDWLNGLDEHKENLTILQGLSCTMINTGHHSYHSTMGAYKVSGISSLKRTTVDYELGYLNPSPLSHIELTLKDKRTGIVSGYSVPTPYQSNVAYGDAETARSELFKVVVDPKAVQSDLSLMRFLRDKLEAKVSHVGVNERRKLLKRIKDLKLQEDQIQKIIAQKKFIGKNLPELHESLANRGANATTPQKQRGMTDVLLGAMISGLTNSATYTIDTLSTPLMGSIEGRPDIRLGIHGLGHGAAEGGFSNEQCRAFVRINHINQVKSIVDRLKEVPEGNGTMFDNTMVMYFAENGETHHSKGTESPFVILSGKNCNLDIAGRYIRLPYHGIEGHKNIGNFWTTLLNAHGNPIEHYGDPDNKMASRNLEQFGAIKKFLKNS